MYILVLGGIAAVTAAVVAGSVAAVRIDLAARRGTPPTPARWLAFAGAAVLLLAGVACLLAGVVGSVHADVARGEAALHARYGATYLSTTDDGLTRLRLPDGTEATCEITGPPDAPVARCLGAELPRTGS